MLYEILDQMKQRPGLYPCENIEDIQTFIYGYKLAVLRHEIEDKELADFQSGFLDFVQAEYKPFVSHANWASIIRLHSATGQDSFQLFFKILEKYRKRVLA